MKGNAKQLSVLFGLCVGYVLALIMGKVDFSAFEGIGLFSMPQLMPFVPEFHPGAIIAVALLYLVSAAETLGDTAALWLLSAHHVRSKHWPCGYDQSR